MKRKKSACLAALCATIVMTGCGSSIPDMTENETHMIAEYAADLLLKYDKNYVVKVVDTTQYHKEEERKAEEARKAAEEAAKAEEAARKEEEAANATSSNGGNNTSEEPQNMVSSIEEFYQVQGVQIQYSGFGIYESYPEQTNEDDLFFALGATEGRKLLVMFFDVTNISGQEMEFNMVDIDPKFKVSVNGAADQSTLFTMLPDALSTYEGTLAADETVRTVIVAEIPTGDSDSIQSLTLTMKDGSDKAQLVLQ